MTIHHNESTYPSVPQDSNISDLELAMRLQAEEDAFNEGRSCHEDVASVQTVIAVPYESSYQDPLRHDNVDPVPIPDSDEILARRIEQEMRDEELAIRLQEQEQQNLQLRRMEQDEVVAPTINQRQLQQQTQIQRQWSRRRACNLIVISSFIVGGAIAAIIFGTNIWSSISGGRLPPIFTDNWSGSNDDTSKGFQSWKTTGKGLKLTVQDALTDPWHSYFRLALADWDKSPALTLIPVNATKADCNPIPGILKVCNDDFGQTGWTGLNEVYFNGDSISSSVAKMNDYYLKKASKEERQYVMCHEIGHGFGLPHRDESTTNPDLGTCLDYTNRPWDNMHPDQIDFDHLANLYLYNSKGNVTNGHFRIMPSELTTKLDDHIRFDMIQWSYHSGRLLHQTSFGAVYENVIADDIRVVTTILFR